MNYDLPSEHFDLSDDELERVMVGETVEKVIGKSVFEIDLESRDVTLTTAQAALLVRALTETSFDTAVESSVAERTADVLQRTFRETE